MAASAIFSKKKRKKGVRRERKIMDSSSKVKTNTRIKEERVVEGGWRP
jgi:hypothetical protein